MNQLSNTSKLDHLPKTTWNSKANRYHTIHTEHLHCVHLMCILIFHTFGGINWVTEGSDIFSATILTVWNVVSQVVALFGIPAFSCTDILLTPCSDCTRLGWKDLIGSRACSSANHGWIRVNQWLLTFFGDHTWVLILLDCLLEGLTIQKYL